MGKKEESESSGSEEESKEESKQSESESGSGSGSESEGGSGSESESDHDSKKKKAPSKATTSKPRKTAPAAKKKKDPNAPKRAMSAYLLYTQEQRPFVKADMEKSGEKVKVTEIMKALAAKWKALTEREKEPYEKKAKAEKERYEIEMKSYRPAESSSEDSSDSDSKGKKRRGGRNAGTKKKPKKDPNAPKRPMTAYLIYSNENREKLKQELKKSNPEAKVTEVVKILAERWKNESEEVKKKYQNKAAIEKEKYTVELEAYNRNKD